MAATGPTNHRARADALRQRITTASCLTPNELRRAGLERSAEGPPLAPPYEALVTQIAIAAYRVTDAQVSAVRSALGSDKATFEMVMSAAVGAGLMRFDRAMQVVQEASNAP
jgi:hypothetical protein